MDLMSSAEAVARNALSDVYRLGGSILFRQEAISAGLVHDVTPDRWYDLVKGSHLDAAPFHFIDNVGEQNWAGRVGSPLYEKMPTATLSCPF